MSWASDSVLPIVYLQAVLAFYYLIFPALSRAVTVLFRSIAKLFPRAEPVNEAWAHKAPPYRGKWRQSEQATRGFSQQQRQHRAEQSPIASPIKLKYLRMLGLTRTAHLIDIRTAYRTLAKTYHPDRFASQTHSNADRAAAESKMRDINEAYDWLCANA